jgi:hypothetical protein
MARELRQRTKALRLIFLLCARPVSLQQAANGIAEILTFAAALPLCYGVVEFEAWSLLPDA